VLYLPALRCNNLQPWLVITRSPHTQPRARRATHRPARGRRGRHERAFRRHRSPRATLRRRRDVMKLFTFHIFNARGECVHSRDWARERVVVDEATEHKTLFGLLFALKDFARQLDPTNGEDGPCNFYAFATNVYKLHYFETATGLRFLLTTDVAAGDLRSMMRHIYSNLFVEYVAKNPALAPTEPFECAAFDRALDAYASALVSP